jgi:RES domain-containing protein
VIYAALSYAGAMLEKLVHTGTGSVPRQQVAIEILIPESVEIEEVTGSQVPGWDRPDLIASRRYGDRWHAEQRTAVLVVPSVVSRRDRNVLINQDHPEFHLIRASRPRPVLWDQRLFRRKSSRRPLSRP